MLSDPSSDIDSIVTELESAILESSAEFRKAKRKVVRKHSKRWFDKDCKRAKCDVNRCLRRFRSSRSDNNLLEYVNSKHRYKRVCKQKRREYNKLYLDKLELNSNNSRSFWRDIKSITGRPRVQPNISLDQWFEHFSNLFAANAEQPMNDGLQADDEIEIIDEIQDMVMNSEITDTEISDAIKSLNVDKSVGGVLLPKQLVYGANVLLPFLCRLFNRLFSKGEFPDKWTNTIIVAVHKKGDVNSANNYRGISLVDVVSKVYIAILTRRVTFYVEMYQKICECQSGFRAGYSTVDNAYILYSVVMKYLSMKRKSLYVAFIDFQKAFDSIDRCILYQVLQKNGINGKLFKSIQSIYKTVKASVRTIQGDTDTFICPVGLRQGCKLSPILFVMFINELYTLMSDYGIRGVQLFPNIVEIFLLMFADDIALIADTVVGLQKQLNVLQSFCTQYKLIVNIAKTKVVVFKRGGRLAHCEKWMYEGSSLEVVNGFTYVGMFFTNRLSLYKMAESTAIKAKKALINVFNSLHQFPCIPYKTFFKLFDAKIASILLYGSELWGLRNMSCVENVHVYACKRFLNANIHACNDAIMGDLGRYPVFIYSARRCIKYWLRILTMPNDRLVRLCYEMLKYYDTLGYRNWVTELRLNLYANGFGYVWETQNVHNHALFIAEYLQRLKDQHVQNWRSKCLDTSKLSYYVNFKQTYEAEKYISAIDVLKFRRSIVNLRSSSHCLMIEKGRHYGISRELRTCPYCEGLIEDEYHFLLICPLYNRLRYMYIPEYFSRNPSVDKFARLMSSSNEAVIRNTAMFIFYAFKERCEYLKIYD